MPRTHGYAAIGKRCVGKQDWQAKGRTNVIGALLGPRLLTAALFTGSVNADVFFAWLSQDLLPKLPQNAVIVMDSCPLGITPLFTNGRIASNSSNKPGISSNFCHPTRPI